MGFSTPATVSHHTTPKLVFPDFFTSRQENPMFYFLIQRTRSSAHSAGFQGKPTSVLQRSYTPLRHHAACSVQLTGCRAGHSSCRPRQRCPHNNQPSVATAPSRRSLELHQQPPRCGEKKKRASFSHPKE